MTPVTELTTYEQKLITGEAASMSLDDRIKDYLRHYQVESVTRAMAAWENGFQRILGVAATGAGKTVMLISMIIETILKNPNARFLVIAHRKELIDQPIERFQSILSASGMDGWLDEGFYVDGILHPRIGVIQAERRGVSAQVIFATIQSLKKDRIEQMLRFGPITHIIVDECHHAVARTYINVINALTHANKKIRILGVTATPVRSDERGLAQVFEKTVFKISIADLVKQRWLVPPRWIGVQTGISLKNTSSADYTDEYLGDVIDNPAYYNLVTQTYQKYAKFPNGAWRQAIAFLPTVETALRLRDYFREAGFVAETVSGVTPKAEREDILARYKRGEVQILTNCAVLTEGFDAPATACILMCRPTKSDSLYIQCMGRGLRPHKGKAEEGEDCLIIDFMPASSRSGLKMAGDVLGVSKEQAEAMRKITETVEEGDAGIGFIFDGETFKYSDKPMQIITMMMNYLEQTLYTWSELPKADGLQFLSIGKADDGYSRTFIVTRRKDNTFDLRGILMSPDRKVFLRNLLSGEEYSRVMEYAEDEATKRGADRLIKKQESWRDNPVTTAQQQFWSRLHKKRKNKKRKDTCPTCPSTSGACAQEITMMLTEDALIDAGILVWNEEGDRYDIY
jgi:superfamily II DNA or RNA helicase